MNAIENTIFSLWLSDRETEQVNAHVKENFVFAEYRHVGENESLLGLLNTVTGEMMWKEPVQVVAFKCIMVMIGNPFHMIGRFAFQLVYSIILIAQAIFNLNVDAFCEAIIDILRVPYCCVGIELAAVLGLLYDPFKGRERLALMELMLNKHIKCTEEGTFYLARCCQPWVYNIYADRRYEIIRTGPTPESVGHRNAFPGCPPFCCLPLIPCCV